MSPISDDLARLAEVTPKLNKAADEASELIRLIEARLAEIGVGIRCRGDRLPSGANQTAELWYTRGAGGCDSRFGFFVLYEDTEVDEYDQPVLDDDGEPIVSRSELSLHNEDRETRIAAAALLPDLIAKILAQVERKNAELDKNLITLRSALSDLKAS